MGVKALACELPATLGVPLSRWHCPDLARKAVEQGLVASISGTTIWRWLSADAIKPWRVRSWIFPRDPHFASKAGRVLDLYHRRWEGRALGRRDYVISADEKTQLQVLTRRHPSAPAAPGRPPRVEHEYRREGTMAYLAAWDVHRAKLFGHIEPTVGNDPFDRLVDEVMATQPYASARRVFFVVDNGTSHRGERSIERTRRRNRRVHLVHLPLHASWLNQVEIFFSVLQRKVLTPTDVTDRAELGARILAFQDHYEQIAQPFDWKFTRSDLDRTLAAASSSVSGAGAA